jgi:hypothetical protein
MKQLRFLLLLALIAVALSAGAQRRVSPVNNAVTATQPINENRQQGDSIDRSKLVEMIDAKGNKILVDTISGREFVDSLPSNVQIPKMIQPLLYSASASIDLLSPALRAFGQSYGLTEIALELNLHNRYIPVVELGLGQANNTPADNNYTYRTPIAPFFRLGVNYNFLYNSNPDYILFAGIRYGLSPFKYSVTNVTLNNDYWSETNTFDIPAQSLTAGYFQFLLGLRVRILSNFSLGWTIRYQSILHESNPTTGKAWYIPGFGSRNSSLSATFSLTYTLPLQKTTPINPVNNKQTK